MIQKLLFSFLTLLFIAATAFAQSPPVDNLYKIAFNGSAVTADGDLTDWQDAQWVYLSVDRPAYNVVEPSANSGNLPASPNDGSGWFAMKMDDDNIYFAVRVRDENAPLFDAADTPENLRLYDHLNVFLGLYDIGPDAYRSPHEELLSDGSGNNLIDPNDGSEIYTGSSYRISASDDNSGCRLSARRQSYCR